MVLCRFKNCFWTIYYYIRYDLQQNLNEQALNVASQICIIKDDIAVEVNVVLYLQVIDSQKASYGIDHYKLPDDYLFIGTPTKEKKHNFRKTVNKQIPYIFILPKLLHSIF